MIEQHDTITNISTRPQLTAARLDDFEAVATLFAELHSYNASLDERFALSASWREVLQEHFQRTCHSPSALWLLAWASDDPVGLLSLEYHQDSPLFRYHSWVELTALYVRPSQRSTGLAQRMMHIASHWAVAHGNERMQLYVTSTNAHARAFYRSCGWRPVQEIWRLELPMQDSAA